MAYQEAENSLFTHDGRTYRLNPVLTLVEGRAPISVLIDELVWNIRGQKYQKDRINRSDTNVPLVVTRHPRYGIVVLDGSHRLAKAVMNGLETISCKFITEKELKPYQVTSSISRKW